MSPPTGSSHLRKTLAACVLAAAVETVIVLSIAEPAVLIFVLGPFLFVALIAWRRRTHLARGRRIQSVAVGIGAFGIAAFAVAILLDQPEQVPIAPLAVPLVQWFAVLYVWIGISREESREKKEKTPNSG